MRHIHHAGIWAAALCALVLPVSLAGGGPGQPPSAHDMFQFSLPEDAKNVILVVSVAALPQGSHVILEDPHGTEVGRLYLFATAAEDGATRYQIVLKPELRERDMLKVRVRIERPGEPARANLPGEVLDIQAVPQP